MSHLIQFKLFTAETWIKVSAHTKACEHEFLLSFIFLMDYRWIQALELYPQETY